MHGWTKIKGGAVYTGVGVRSFRKLLKQGLRFSRLKTGTILVRYSDIDDFLKQFEVTENEVEKITGEVLGDLL